MGVMVEARRLTIHQLLKLAEDVTTEYFAGEVEPLTLSAVAYIESGGNPKAMRTEPDGKVSVGLCQTLCSTARWLITDTTPAAPPKLLVHRPVGAPVPKPPEIADPSQITLMDPFTAMWYGAAYLAYLSIYDHQGHPEEWVVRAYNAGPTGVEVKNTDRYWAKFSQAKTVIQAGLKAVERGGGLYQIEAGDTMWGIVQALGIPQEKLLHANPQIKDSSHLQVGDLLVLPPLKETVNFVFPPDQLRRPSLARNDSIASCSSAASSAYSTTSRIRRLSEAGFTLALTVCAGILVFKFAGGSNAAPLQAGPHYMTTRRTRQPEALPALGVVEQPPATVSEPRNRGRQTAYTIKEGDTLFGVAQELGVSVHSVVEYNPALSNPNRITPGMSIIVPPT